MGNVGLVTIAGVLVAYAFLSKRLSKTAFTGPLIFMAFGLVAGPTALGWLDPDAETEVVSLVLEATLILVLFADAFSIDLGGFRDAVRLPGRLLGVGFPLMVLIGWGAAAWMFPELRGAPALLVAILLAPTDAALGQAVISNPRVPARVRNALNIESGLNDGLALPIFFVVLEAASAAEIGLGGGAVLRAVVVQVLVASLVGVALGGAAARFGILAFDRDWAEAGWIQIGLVSVAMAAWALADGLGASGFIAAWVAGLTCGITGKTRLNRPVDFSEDLGNVLTLISFTLFGALAVGQALPDLDIRIVTYAVLSLAVIRMISVMIATVGSGLAPATTLYLGWFGPRGLASIILVLIVLEDSRVPETPLIAQLMVATVALSVIFHGATAWWGSNRYGDWSSQNADPHQRTAE
ncbi:MAG: cation:proton antiporter [Acidimicrobiia bacterium]|nr:cation:proton antiporter [Acidimicrobiia bacterium]